MTFYKYNGAGNDFLVADNRDGSIHLTEKYISEICDRHYGVGADGVMLLGTGCDGADFTMNYYNSDGSGGMMCGNGGRCIVAFASFLGLKPASQDGRWSFVAADGEHRAELLSSEGNTLTVRLQMIDISVARHYDSLKNDASASGWFVDTGTRHFVHFVDTPLTSEYVDAQGRKLRHAEEFAPLGANVNFVVKGNPLKVRTFEKGVEAETCACGTGITASAAAAWLSSVQSSSVDSSTSSVHYSVMALNDELAVDLTPTDSARALREGILSGDILTGDRLGGDVLFTDVWLTGPASLVAKLDIF